MLGFTEKLHHIMLYQADLNRQESNSHTLVVALITHVNSGDRYLLHM
jgi:hypothetical protein